MASSECLLSRSSDKPSPKFTQSNALMSSRRREDQNQNQSSAVPTIPESIFDQQLKFKQVLLIFLAYISIGSLCFFLVRYQLKGKKTNPLLDSIYFCVVTMTTVGYGDLVPDTVLAKLLACIFVFTGMALVGYLLSKVADYILEREGLLFFKALNTTDKSDFVAENHKIRYKFFTTLALLFLLVLVGTLFLFFVESFDFFDAFYCVCTTITTLGYGDKSFSTKGGRVFAIFWMLTSTLLLAQLFIYLAEFCSESRRRMLVDWVLKRKMTVGDLEAADLDNDKVVSVAEFVVHKLKEMGKISKEDVSLVMEHFRNHDLDQSGTLTESDLMPDRPS